MFGCANTVVMLPPYAYYLLVLLQLIKDYSHLWAVTCFLDIKFGAKSFFLNSLMSMFLFLFVDNTCVNCSQFVSTSQTRSTSMLVLQILSTL